MKRIRITIEGFGSGLLTNPMTEALAENLRKGVREPNQYRTMTPQEEAASRLVKNDEGVIGLPVSYVFGCLIHAGRKVQKKGRANWTTSESSEIPTVIEIEEDFFPMTNSNGQPAPWKPFFSVPYNEKGIPVPLVRPRFANWEATFTLVLQDDEMPEKTCRQLVDIAGSKVGLGSWSPRRKGRFGRFRVKNWEVLSNGNEAESAEEAAVTAK